MLRLEMKAVEGHRPSSVVPHCGTEGGQRTARPTNPKGIESSSPALTRSGYAGFTSQNKFNRNAVASPFYIRGYNPFRVDKFVGTTTQGSSATLGWMNIIPLG